MGAADRGGVRVAPINRDPTARGDCLGSRPVERVAEDAVWINDSTPENSLAALIVISELG